MSTSTVRALTTIDSTQLRDDVVETALANGFTLQDVERLEKQLQYRKQYNLRPEVKAKRAEYTHARYLKMKALKNLLTSL